MGYHPRSRWRISEISKSPFDPDLPIVRNLGPTANSGILVRSLTNKKSWLLSASITYSLVQSPTSTPTQPQPPPPLYTYIPTCSAENADLGLSRKISFYVKQSPEVRPLLLLPLHTLSYLLHFRGPRQPKPFQVACHR